MSNKKIKYGYTPQKVNYKVFLFALITLASTVLYVLSTGLTMTIDIPGTKVPLIYPMDFFSIVGLLVYLAYMFLWGFIGYKCSKSGIVFWKLLIGINAFPILCTVVFYVGLAIDGMVGLEGDFYEIIGAAGCGFASYIGTVLYYIFKVNFINDISVALNLAFMLGVFALGYSVGTPKKKK